MRSGFPSVGHDGCGRRAWPGFLEEVRGEGRTSHKKKKKRRRKSRVLMSKLKQTQPCPKLSLWVALLSWSSGAGQRIPWRLGHLMKQRDYKVRAPPGQFTFTINKTTAYNLEHMTIHLKLMGQEVRVGVGAHCDPLHLK